MAQGAAPLFRRLAQSIGDAIGDGTYAVGERLPTEIELARRHGVSRHTVREALGTLRDRGLIESRQGIGSVVVRANASSGYAETYSSIEELTRFAEHAPLRVLGVDEMILDDAQAALCDLGAGQSWLRIDALRPGAQTGDPPLAHVEVYVDPTYGRVRGRLDRLAGSVAETIASLYGIEIARIEQAFSVTQLDARQAELLGVPAKTPAMLIRRWYAGEDGRIFEVALSRYPMDRFSYRNVLVRRRPE
jgi:DNA-binding GntR family transcriptional regulator